MYYYNIFLIIFVELIPHISPNNSNYSTHGLPVAVAVAVAIAIVVVVWYVSTFSPSYN